MIITISASARNTGKTSLAIYLIENMGNCGGIKCSIHSHSPHGEGITEEKEISETDTGKMIRAGAKPVYWVKTSKEQLKARIEEIFEIINNKDFIIESNSILEYLNPHYSIFIMNRTFEDFKDSAWNSIRKADTIIINGLPSVDVERKCRELNKKGEILFLNKKEITYKIIANKIKDRRINMGEVDTKILEELKKRSKEGRIACSEALKIAEDLNVSSLDVGKGANELEIKIKNCSLGCFK